MICEVVGGESQILGRGILDIHETLLTAQRQATTWDRKWNGWVKALERKVSLLVSEVRVDLIVEYDCSTHAPFTKYYVVSFLYMLPTLISVYLFLKMDLSYLLSKIKPLVLENLQMGYTFMSGHLR